MPQHGVYANRNAGHKTRQAELFALARGDARRLGAAFDWFRSSARLLDRRRPPKAADQQAYKKAAARLVQDVTQQLKELAEAIDRGDYDAVRGDRK